MYAEKAVQMIVYPDMQLKLYTNNQLKAAYDSYVQPHYIPQYFRSPALKTRGIALPSGVSPERSGYPLR